MTRPLTEQRRIDAPPPAVWRAISAPGHLEQVHPFVAANPVHAWPGDAAHDTIVYHNGRTVERRFTAWHDGAGYDLEVTDANGPAASVSWRLTADGGGGSRLAISLTPRMLGGVPAFLRPIPLAAVRVMMRRYLRSVLAGVAWRATTGTPVRRNQFGPHPWFSPAQERSKR